MVGRANRLKAETRALRACKLLTVARGQPRESDMYWGRITSIRAATPLMRSNMTTVKVGFGTEKSVRREVYEERDELMNS